MGLHKMEHIRINRLLHRLALLCGLATILMGSVWAADSGVGEKTGNMAVIYGITSLLALILAVGCFRVVEKKEPWFLILYSSVFVVNLGYFALSVSESLEAVMLANSISYLGSVFLPLSMLMIIMKVCRIQTKKWALILLTCISICTFLLAASGDSLGLYYKEVSVVYIGTVATLKKVYGPLHCWYLIYLLSYFLVMVTGIVYSFLKKRIDSFHYGVILASLVLGNIGVWYIEQLVHWNFEFLSVTYIITELFLLLLYDVMQDYELLQRKVAENAAKITSESITEQRIKEIITSCPALEQLTTREREVLMYLLRDMPRKEIAETLYVTENTVKKHTSNIFFKLEVASRRELLIKLDQQTPVAAS